MEIVVIIAIILISLIATFFVAYRTNRIWIAYLLPFLIINISIIILDFYLAGYINPWTPIALVILSAPILGGSFLGHIIWIFYCFEKGKNITYLDDLDK